MRLLLKTSIINLLLTGFLLVIGGWILYLQLTSMISQETDEKMITNKERIITQIEEDSVPFTSLPPVLEVKPVSNSIPLSTTFKDTLMFDPVEEDQERFRELSSVEEIDGEHYQIIVRQVILERHDYWEYIRVALLYTWLLLLACFVVVNWGVSKMIWRSFHTNLKSLKAFKVGNNLPLQLRSSKTKEFKDLNKALLELTNKVNSDYISLKEFSENAAHEMQTPLAIIQTKLEGVVQLPGLTEQQAAQLQASLSALKRLTKLNQSLLLLSKIDNRQFTKTRQINLKEGVNDMLNELRDFSEAKNITIASHIAEEEIASDPVLLDILLSNLLSNAIKYNVNNGHIAIDFKDKILRITNSSDNQVIQPEKMFDRFVKGDPSSQSPGLGLAIVKKICDIQGWTISYQVKENQHLFEIRF